MDDFFEDLRNTKPFLKAGFYGNAGTGKTHTAALLAIGIHRHIKSTKPIVYFDTELAAKFLLPLFDEAGIEVKVRNSRSITDLVEAMRMCRENGYADVLIIDSITHVYEHMVEAYKAKRNRTALELRDWGIIKPAWSKQFADPYVRDPYHIVMCGRAGDIYASERNEETGKTEMYKDGVRMRAGGDVGYEPDLLVYMERLEELKGKNKGVWRTATVAKDRTTIVDGKTFTNPTFEDFRPAIESILKDPSPRLDQTEADPTLGIRTEEDKREWTRRRDIALEVIEAKLTKAYPGSAAIAKRLKVEALEAAYNTGSWTAIQGMRPEAIERGHSLLDAFVAEHPAPPLKGE